MLTQFSIPTYCQLEQRCERVSCTELPRPRLRAHPVQHPDLLPVRTAVCVCRVQSYHGHGYVLTQFSIPTYCQLEQRCVCVSCTDLPRPRLRAHPVQHPDLLRVRTAVCVCVSCTEFHGHGYVLTQFSIPTYCQLEQRCVCVVYRVTMATATCSPSSASRLTAS